MIRSIERAVALLAACFARRASEGEASAAMEGRDAGLTLIETIVALGLAALVVAFLAQGTGLVRHFARLGRVVSAQDETLAIRDHLRRTVESAVRSTDKTHRDTFSGVVDTAVFTIPGDRLLEAGGPVRVTLAAVAEGARFSLVETRAPVGVPGEKGRARRLVTGAAQVQFAYYGAAGNKADWLPEWTDPGASPSLMRVDVTFPRGDTRRWPPFVVLMPTGGASAPAAQPTDGADPPARKPG